MRKSLLGLASLLVGGGVAEAQYPMPSRTPMPPQAIPHGVPQAVPYAAPMPYPSAMHPAAMPHPGAYRPMPGVGDMGTRFPSFNAAETMSSPPPMAMPQPSPMPVGFARASDDVPVQSAISEPIVATSTDIFGNPFHRYQGFFVKGEWLIAKINNGPLSAPLVTTGSPNDPNPGAISPANPGTAVLFGGTGLDYGLLNGFRAQGGLWIGDRGSIDVVGTYFSPITLSYGISSDANGNPLVARPIINAIINEPRSLLTSLPGALQGSTNVDSTTSFWSLEFNARYHVPHTPTIQSEGLIGFRTANLRENLRIQDSLRDINGGFLTFNGVPLDAGDRLFEEDAFDVSNQFYGFQVGGAASYEKEWFVISVIGKLAMGITDQHSTIAGVTNRYSATQGDAVAPGGVLAQLSNMGDRHRYAFGLIPEAGANIGVNLHRNVRVTTGYTFILWNDVLRPGSMVDIGVNPGQIPGSPNFGAAGPARPAYASPSSQFIAHTFNFGLEVRY